MLSSGRERGEKQIAAFHPGAGERGERGSGEGEGCPGQATGDVVPLGVGHGSARSMAATGTPWRALRASRAREGGAMWTPARPPLGLGARAIWDLR